MNRIVLLALVAGCSPKVDVAPDRAGCTEVTTTDVYDDGTIDVTLEVRYDAEGRRISAHYETGDGVFTFDEAFTFDGEGCQVAYRYEQESTDGDSYLQTSDVTCDANQDVLTESLLYRGRGSQEFTQRLEYSWERTYDAEGRTSDAVRTETYPDFEFSLETTFLYTYDDLGRLLQARSEGDRGASTTTQTWFDELRTDQDLLATTEQRNGLGVLTEGRYRTYDERGRIVLERTVDDERIPTEVETTWAPRGWVPLSSTHRTNGVITQEVTATTDGEDPFLSIEFAYDGYDGEGTDGTIDARSETVWSCP